MTGLNIASVMYGIVNALTVLKLTFMTHTLVHLHCAWQVIVTFLDPYC